MKIKIILLLTLFAATASATAQVAKHRHEDPYNEADKYIESAVIPMGGKKGFSFETRAGDFMLKPYVLLQTAGKFNWYDDEQLGLDDQDNVANSGFEIPYAILGISGRAFNKLTFNLTLNAAKSGGALLQQAWVDVNLKDQIRFRVGKFKTPFSQAYLVTLGETLFPVLPTSLTSSVYMDRSLNSTPPTIATGFDLGVMMHGLLGGKWEYNLGVFNGTGIDVNMAQKTLSDDLGIPSLLYAARVAFMPKGPIPAHQGRIDDLHNDKIMFALSASYNVEANWQTTNDLRQSQTNVLALCAVMGGHSGVNPDAVGGDPSKISDQGPYWISSHHVYNQPQDPILNACKRLGLDNRPENHVQVIFDPALLDGNDGFLNMPAVGLNYYIMGYNLKLQAMYQFLGRWGHATQDARELDDLGLAQHSATVMLQFSF